MAGVTLRSWSRSFLRGSGSGSSLQPNISKRLLSLHGPPPYPSVSLVPASIRNTGISASYSCFPSGAHTRALGTFHGHGRFFTSEAIPRINTKVNFSVPDSDGEDEFDGDDNSETSKTLGTQEISKHNLQPPYDPFSKKPVIEEPKDPKDLQEIFHNMRTKDGLLNSAVKMFDALSKDGLTHEALELFAQIKDKGHMPDVVAHTAVIEAYAKAGQPKEALKVYLRMLASGVAPNAYTYTVLIKGLAADARYVGDAKTYVLEMMSKGMKPNAGTYTAVFEALVKEQRLDEAREFLEKMKNTGFMPDEKSVREVLNNKQGQVCRTVINILFGK